MVRVAKWQVARAAVCDRYNMICGDIAKTSIIDMMRLFVRQKTRT